MLDKKCEKTDMGSSKSILPWSESVVSITSRAVLRATLQQPASVQREVRL